MTRFVRLLLVCCLSLSIPLQGWASLVMSMPAAAQTESHASSSQDMPPCHVAMHLDTSAEVHGQHAGLPVSPSKAKMCNGCCGAMMGSAALPLMPVVPGHDQYLSCGLPDPADHIPSGLERPPRSLS